MPDSLSLKERSYVFACVRAELFAAVLVVRQGKNVDRYGVAEEPPEVVGVAAVRVFLLANVGNGNVYQVTAPRAVGEVGVCSCQGFARWKTCKHADCLCDLVQERELPQL